MKNLLPNKAYDVLKWIAVIVIPALVIFIKTVFPVWDIPYSDQIATTLTAVGLLIGALIGVSTVQYNNNVNADIQQIGKEIEEERNNEGI